MSWKNIIVVILLLVFFVSSVSASVEVFTEYNTVLNITPDNKIFVRKSLTLKNVYDVGIVPGQIEFKIGRAEDGNIRLLRDKVKAVDQFGNVIKTTVRETKDFSTIILDVYYPLLPGFTYSFDLTYEMEYEPGGIFFKNLEIPIRESTIPIEGGVFKVVLPKEYKFTYIDSDNLSRVSVNDNIAEWKIKNNLPKSIGFEYSYIPISIKGVRGSYVFWISLNVLLFLVLIWEIRREIGRIEYENRHHRK